MIRGASGITLAALIVVPLCVGACTTADDPPTLPQRRPLTMQLAGGDGFLGVPFPDNQWTPDRLADFPNPSSSTILRSYLDEIQENWPGFGTNSGIFVRFENAPFDARLPGPAASVSDTSTVLLINIDPDHPTFGDRIPLELNWRPNGSTFLPSQTLVAMPVSGFTLHPATTYGLALSSKFGGWSLHRAEWFRDRLEAADAAGLESLYRSGELPFWPVAGAIFTTQDPVSGLADAADVVANWPEPPRTVTWQTTGSSGSCRLVEAFVEVLSFQQGDKPYTLDGGNWRFDDNGPVTAGTDRVRTIIAVPSAAMPDTGWPTLLMSHGTGSDADSWTRTRCSATQGDFDRRNCQQELCRAGIASVSSEQPLHGTRLPPDAPLDESILTFNLFNILAIRDNIRQGAADLVSVSRWLRDLDAPASQFPLAERFRINPDRFLFMGHSQGTNAGIPYLAVQPGVHQAAVLSGASGGLALALLYKTLPVNIPALVEAAIGSWSDYDLFHPALSLFQTFAESADTLNYARYIQGPGIRSDSAARPLHLFVSEGLTDEHTPPQLLEALAVNLDVEWAGPGLAPIDQFDLLDPPRRPINDELSGNRNIDGTTVTSVLRQYPEDHFAAFDNPDAGADLLQFLIDAAQGKTPAVQSR